MMRISEPRTLANNPQADKLAPNRGMHQIFLYVWLNENRIRDVTIQQMFGTINGLESSEIYYSVPESRVRIKKSANIAGF
jgi:hypothetical protein